MNNLPSGTITFLFTDIGGSTKRWEEYPAEMQAALSRHDDILRTAIEGQGGYVFKTVGDAFCAAFSSPHLALKAALASQQALHKEQWPEQTGTVAVRMALHTGAVEEQGGDYFGQPLNRVARILSAGHGGQVLMSLPTYELVRDHLPTGVTLLELGEHRLKDLLRPELIYQPVTPDLPSSFPPLKTLDTRPNNLPRQATAFIGREDAVRAIAALLLKPDVTLVTLTGTGGTGKTRVGLQAGADLLDEFPDGVRFVELSPISESNLVVPTILQTLGVKDVTGQPPIETLKAFLREKQLLLILDNFEQVVEAATQVSSLLVACANLKLLVTSRIPLRIRGEREYAISPLALPDTGHLPPLDKLTQFESVRLFIERATDVKADFHVTNDNAPAVAEICARLDGLPLAIELAAARVKMLPPQALLARLSSRLKVLTGGARDLTNRQQTLRGAIDWSYDLLDEGEKQLFRRLAPFSGGRSLEAMEAVCNADRLQIFGRLKVELLDGVMSLIDKSLLQQREGRDGEPRFWMLETLHEYAREKLEESGEEEALALEHARHFLRFAEEAETHLNGAEQVEWLRRLEDEHDNLRAALAWAKRAGERGNAVGQDNEALEIALRIAGALEWFWTRAYVTEGREQLTGLINLTGRSDFAMPSTSSGAPGAANPAKKLRSRTVARAKALLWGGYLSRMLVEFSVARSYLEESLALSRRLDDKHGIASALNSLAWVAFWQSRPV